MTEKNLFKDLESNSSPILQSDFDDLLELQSRVLGMAASHDDCSEPAQQLCFMAEKLAPNSVASIMLYDKSDQRLYVHTAPSLTDEAIDALNGLQIGVGSCGNAVYHDEAMYICNTLADNRWRGARSYAETFNIAACWSMPIHNDKGEVIGSFALSSFEVREASNFQRKLLHICASVAGILLQKEEYLKQSTLWEKEMLKSEKLESIGVLAGGIAHDFNNLLGVVIGNIEMVERAIDRNSKAYIYLLSAEKASKHAAALTQQLLTFSKGGDPVKKLSDIREVVQDSAEFLLHGSGVALSFENQCENDDLLIADIDNGQISQVIQNVVINARQAMNNSGDIIIRFSSATNLPGADNGEFKAEKYHKIEIQDTGPGIPADIIDKVFDPYFTTKSEGSGLGLALSFSVIKKHEGYLYVDSKPGIGSCFTIYLPAAEASLQDMPDNNDYTTAVDSKGCILVMDDQEMLHDVAEAMLEELGYQTIHAYDGDEVIEKYGKALAGGDKIDLIIMDLTIPGGMGGQEAIKEILSLDPDANVVVCSGYSNDSVMSKFGDYGFKGALAKPYDINELDNILNQILAD